MDKILSISRSGDLDKGGNALKSPKLQSEFFVQIERKLNDYLRDYPTILKCSSPSTGQLAAQDNILIQLRKLREGLLSTKRADSFALQVYELSFYFAVSCQSTTHQQSTANTLPALYRSSERASTRQPPQTTSQKQRATFAVIRLLQSLTETRSFGNHYHTRLAEVNSYCQLESVVQSWLQELLMSIIRGNITHSMLLTHDAQRERKARDLGLNTNSTAHTIAKQALSRTLLNLRSILRDRAWTVTRTAYRQITVSHDDWCYRSLGFQDKDQLESWLKEREKLGEANPRPESTTVWLLHKPKQ